MSASKPKAKPKPTHYCRDCGFRFVHVRPAECRCPKCKSREVREIK